jgi:hypothetical protein
LTCSLPFRQGMASGVASDALYSSSEPTGLRRPSALYP